MSNVVIRVNGNTLGDGFLVAPDGGRTFPVPLNLSTNDGTTVTATIDASPNGGGVALPAGPLVIGPGGTDYPIFATAVSNSRGDTVIHVHVGAATTSFSLTAIGDPQIWFRGRFQARFAVDPDYYNNRRGSDGGTPGSSVPGEVGWTWALEGEPDFVPANSIPTTPFIPVGRVVRFNNPVSLRSHAAPVVTTVNEIWGSTLSGTEVFTAGDPVLGTTVNLGPNTYLAGNFLPNPVDPPPAEINLPGLEPMALFECHVDGFFTGASASLADRPTPAPQGAVPLDAAEQAAAGIPPLAQFESTRLAALQADFNALSPADQTGTVAGRNLTTRILHLTTLYTYERSAWTTKEEFHGNVNEGITLLPNGSSVIQYLSGYLSFAFFAKLFTFHSDELCGYVHGSLSADRTAPRARTCSLLVQNSTFGKDQLRSLGLPVDFTSAFWLVLDGFYPWELGINAAGQVTDPTRVPQADYSIDLPAAADPAIVAALRTQGQMVVEPFSGQVLTQSLPPPNSPQRFLYPFTIRFSGVDGFVMPSEMLTLTASIPVGGQTFTASAKLELVTSANPYVLHADAGNQYTFWLATDLRVFSVDDDEVFFGSRVEDFYPPGATGVSYPVPAADASAAATQYIATVIALMTANAGRAGNETFDGDLSELEDNPRSLLEFHQLNPRTRRAAFNFAICRVRIQGTTPTGPGTTQATNCRVFFRAFQAQTTTTSFQQGSTYRETPSVPGYGRRVPLLGVQTDAMGQDEYVTIPFFAVDRINLASPTDLTLQPEDVPNVQTLSPITNSEVDTYYGCWLDMNQPTLLFPQYAPPGDWDNAQGSFGTSGSFAIQSIYDAFVRAPHQCLVAEVAFDDVPIPPGADSSNSDKLAQRNLAWVDGPNPGVAVDSRRMPHPFQVPSTRLGAKNVDELMITWGNTPPKSTASIYLPGASAAEILALANALYGEHLLRARDPSTIDVPVGPVSFVPVPRGVGALAGLLTVDLPVGIRRGDRYRIVVRQVTDAVQRAKSRKDAIALSRRKGGGGLLSWRKVSGAFQVNLLIGTKNELLRPEEDRLAVFRSIAQSIAPTSRWHPVMLRYVDQLARRVAGFGGDPNKILPDPCGYVAGQRPAC